MPGGLVNAVGLPNPGLEHFLATELPWLVRAGVRVIVSIAGATMGEYADLARRLSRAPGVAGLEVNVGAPDEAGAGLFEVREPYHSASVIAAVRREFPADRPVLAKLRPDVSRIVEGARACHEAGATAVVVGNAVPAAFPDGRAGGLSGPAIAPIALRCVAVVRDALPELPTIGCGGVRDTASARAYLDAGATAVQVGTALLHDPTTVARLRAALHPSHPGGRMTPFGTRLARAIEERGRFCVGIDPHAALLREWGLDDDVASLERFALTVVEAVAPVVGVVKPQSAFYERFGSRGVAVLERVIAESRAAGALVLLDVKRGDIGSTSQAYADAYLDPASPLASDAITASPYLGFGSLDPMVEACHQHGGGLFVLALTSNKEGPEVQHARSGDRTVAGTVLDRLRAAQRGRRPGGLLRRRRRRHHRGTEEDLDINGPFLVPGYGAQGGTVADLGRIFGASARWALPSSSREVLQAGPRRHGPARRGATRQ